MPKLNTTENAYSIGQLMKKIKSQKARIGVIGLGYVGLPLVIEFCRAGFNVTGFDISRSKVESLNRGKSYIRHIDISRVPSGKFTATTDFKLLGKADCILITVPTPLNKNREPDMSFVFETARSIAGRLRKGQLIILESTTYPGTTDGEVREILEASGLRPAGISSGILARKGRPEQQRFQHQNYPESGWRLHKKLLGRGQCPLRLYCGENCPGLFNTGRRIGQAP